jgi:hypothetical protein
VPHEQALEFRTDLAYESHLLSILFTVMRTGHRSARTAPVFPKVSVLVKCDVFFPTWHRGLNLSYWRNAKGSQLG